MPTLGDWEDFWSGEPVIFVDEPLGELRARTGEDDERSDTTFPYIDITYRRRTGRRE